MDPHKLIAALMASDPTMSPDLAQRIAENLMKPNGAREGYPEWNQAAQATEREATAGYEFTNDGPPRPAINPNVRQPGQSASTDFIPGSTPQPDPIYAATIKAMEAKRARIQHYEMLKAQHAQGVPLAPADEAWINQVHSAPAVAPDQTIGKKYKWGDKYDPNTPGGAILQANDAMRSRGKDTGWDDFSRGMMDGLTREPPVPIPNFTPSNGMNGMNREPVAMSESGQPIYEPDAPPPTDARGRQVLQIPADAQLTDEAGYAIDKRGKRALDGGKPFYAEQDQEGARTADRRASDVMIHDPRKSHVGDEDAFAIGVIQRQYGEHLQAMEDNRDGNGVPTDKFPAGYFDGMSKDKRQNIEAGVRWLRAINKGPRI